MTEIETFAAYAQAFERAYESDQWEEVRASFDENAVYEVLASPPFGGVWKGRDTIVAHLMESVNGFDRTYDERILRVISGPEMRDGAVHIRWGVTYKKAGTDDLSIEGEEEAWVKDGKILRLKDTMPS